MFKPTRFTFLVRNSAGETPTDGRQQAFILPLPGRALKPLDGEPVPEPVLPPSRIRQQRPALAPEAEPEPPRAVASEASQEFGPAEIEPGPDFSPRPPEPIDKPASIPLAT